MTPSSTPSFCRMLLKYAMSFNKAAYSSSIFSRSMPVRRWSRMSRMAWACTWLNPTRAIRPSRAASTVPAARMMRITSSM